LKTSSSASTSSRAVSGSCGATFDVPANRKRLAELEQQVSKPGFWDDQAAAQRVLQQRKQASERVDADAELTRRSVELETFIELIREESNDAQREGLLAEAAKELEAFEDYLAKLETKVLLAGEHDALNAILTVKPGAGGTESQDWAEMLLRMYLRWAERSGMRATVLDSTPGEEAGLKSATVRIEGENAYGLLAGESGVHRLVRISPFDQAARRHTSFASVFVIPEIDDSIEIHIRPDELRIDTFRAGGHGGQHVNVTDSAVRITHIPSGLVVQCQNERSQHKNRESAMKVLRSRLYEYELEKRREAQRKLDEAKPEISFGSQIRSYVLHPYRMIKDHRTKFEMGDTDRVLDGDLDPFIHAYLAWRRNPAAVPAGASDTSEELD
jgi:peptide chain release factor 2